jgi:succinate dehydrogenase / fumarate reductase membrane anchor subunit
MNTSDLQTPLKRARGLGSAKDGTHHFVVQRITALALVPLALWVIWLALALVRADYAHARAIVHHPFAAIWLTAFVIATFWHAQLGLQVVIEDYVHARAVEITLHLLNMFLCTLGAIASVYAIARIALTA